MQAKEATLTLLGQFRAEIPEDPRTRGIPISADGRIWILDMSFDELCDHVQSMEASGIEALGESTVNFHPGAALTAIHLEETMYSLAASESDALYIRADESGFYRA